jgi:hypothetical protein
VLTVLGVAFSLLALGLICFITLGLFVRGVLSA